VRLNKTTGPHFPYKFIHATTPIYLLGFITALHALLATRSNNEKAVLSVRPSARLSLTRVICDKTKETCAHILIPHERPFILVLWQKEWLVGATLLPEIVGQTGPVGAKSPIFGRCSLVAPQP